MQKQDFTVTFMLDESPQQVFEAVNNVRGWWSEMVEGGTEKKDDEFIYRHKDIHYSKQRLTEVMPDKKVVWLVTESDLTFIGDGNEWAGTEVIFEISKEGDKTQLIFTHKGLVPAKECFNACSGGWNYYLQSLRNLITTGEGNPDRKEATVDNTMPI